MTLPTTPKLDHGVWVYDIEQFANFHSFTAYNVATKVVKAFVLFDHSRFELKEYLDFLKNEACVLIGYNNVNYDYPMLHYLMENGDKWLAHNIPPATVLKCMYQQGQFIINSEYSAIYQNKVKIPQIDLYRIHHFDNINKATSLKWIEFALRWHRVQDLPFNFNHYVSADEIDDILDYNLNDVMATNEFLNASKKELELRISLSREYNNPTLINANDAKIGSEIFAHYLSVDMEIPISRLKRMRTRRKEIALSECIMSYVKFKSKEFNALLEYLKDRIVTDTSGMFSDIPIDSLGGLKQYIAPSAIKSKKKYRGKVANNLSVNYKGLNYVYGTGGLHACCEAGSYYSDDKWVIVDVDVKMAA